ncbi:MAG: VanZ family protein, partial [Clostridiales bacterium]|nr:VanZ family protein [Clostridiales bacterium]
MRQEKIKTIIAWALVLICMAFIFCMSSFTADESTEQSMSILDILIRIFGDNALTDFIVRKSAHVLEFAGLSFLFNIALWQTKKKNMFILAVLLTSIYAASDEIHQLFVDGRAGKVVDWAIDTSGAILGAIAYAIVFLIICCIV